ncbi:hypothetical protein K438DRAFT_800093 [Mycena galopus ATCC 62051]|nr:hypothetical protein K438DRAFT_800093 [Mycena galopus ATCC 62051]
MCEFGTTLAPPPPFALSCTRCTACPPLTSAFCSSTISYAMRSVTTIPIAVRSTHPALTTSRLTPCPQHQAAVHLRFDAQQALWSLDSCAASLIVGAATIFRVLGARLRAVQLGWATPAPCAVPAVSIPHPIRYFPCLSPAMTIFGSAPVSPVSLSRAAPRTIRTHHHPHAQRLRGCSSSATPRSSPRTTTFDASPLRPLVYHRRRSTRTRLTPNATGMRNARRRPRLNHQEALVAHSRRPSAAQLPPGPPCSTSDCLPCASSVPASLERDVRDPPRLPAAPAVAGDRL